MILSHLQYLPLHALRARWNFAKTTPCCWRERSCICWLYWVVYEIFWWGKQLNKKTAWPCKRSTFLVEFLYHVLWWGRSKVNTPFLKSGQILVFLGQYPWQDIPGKWCGKTWKDLLPAEHVAKPLWQNLRQNYRKIGPAELLDVQPLIFSILDIQHSYTMHAKYIIQPLMMSIQNSKNPTLQN